ncbi:hypothetical protein A4A49_37807 [Nicotiana attenuata]|uniref:Uncharacterized protein n=1 Tax=Nicotiana attenuata TaxID=49451 RepID=A0A1J6HY24_NICAT|nr:hypothetical protein A4A49_37807 [Nicotiana attenuata]
MEKILFWYFQANEAQMCVMIRQKRNQQCHGCKTPVACVREDSKLSTEAIPGCHAKIRVGSTQCPNRLAETSSLPLYVPTINSVNEHRGKTEMSVCNNNNKKPV